MTGQLKLSATDAADIDVLSSCLQDAIVPMTEMAYFPAENRFVLVASRFCWEDTPARRLKGAVYERTNCGVSFESVSAVRLRNIDQHDRESMLSLLAIRADEGYIDLLFSGGGTIRLEVNEISCHIDDMDQRWPTRWKPEHPEG
jgi:hypothetical protein